MRNLKRALSLALAMVMLLGMMMINTNAASNFADADQIVNKEAVEITAGMGLFAGSDGKFNPQGNVTRAQMATIIVKMLRGSDFNADAFKGAANPFSDTAAFEGGWAEGYINACFQMGVVKGYGDGTFKPGNSVTTAEAVTMIINALGVDAGQGEWPLTVMAKASAMKLFGDLNPAPATNDALVRDQLAVITLEGLQYSDTGKSGYKVEGLSFVFDNMTDALKAAGYDATKITEVVGDDTLANSVYSMNVATGFITENKATGADYTVVGDETFDIETGLDMVGHYVSIYYKNPAQGEYVEAYETYAVVDESTVVVVSEDLDSSKEYKAAFGRNYDLKTTEGGELDVLVFDGEYNIVDAVAGETPYIPGSSAPKGTYIIYENKVVAFLRPGTAIASQILSITDLDGEKTYTLAGVDNPIDETDITVYGGAKADDYVTYTMAGGQYVLSPVDPMKGTATKYSTSAEGEITVTVGGIAYPLFDDEANDTGLDANPATLDLSATQYTFYVTLDGKIVGWAGADGSSSTDVNVDDIVYALGWFALENKQGNYGEKVKKYYLQGVNTEGEEAHVLLAVEYDTNKDGTFAGAGDEATLGTVPAEAYREGFYITSDPENKDAKKEGVKDVIRIGVKDERNAATGNLFYGLNRYGSSGENNISWPNSFANNHVCTTACAAETTHNNTIVSGAGNHSGSGDTDSSNKATRTFFGSDVKYVMIDGVLGEELETDAGGSEFSWTLPSTEGMKHPMLYKLNDVGATEIVMVAIRKDPSDLDASTSDIFVADNTPVASSAEGDLYTVYDAVSGTAQEVVLHGTDGESAPAVGFWTYKVEDDGSWTQMAVVKNDQKLGYETDTLTELYFSGLFDGKTVSASFANGDSVPFITGADASAAKVVDLRSESEKSASGISTISSVEQLGNLAESGKLVTMYVYNKGKTTTGCIYVKAIANNPTGVIYVTDPTTGAAVTLDGKFTTVAVTAGAMFGGFARVETTEGIVALTPVVDVKYRTNELLTSVSGSTINTETIGASPVAMTAKVTSSTTFADTTALGIDSLAELEAALDAGKALTVAIAGVNGGNASLVVVTGQGDPYLANGDQVYVQAPVAGSVRAQVISGVKAGSEHTFGVVEVVYPETINVTKATAVPGYYTVNKDGEGAITLTFEANFIPANGDAFYIQEHVSAAGKNFYALVVSNENGLTAGTWGYVQIPAEGTSDNSFKATQATSRFWIMQDGTLTRFLGTYHVAANAGAYKFGYHDVIKELTSTTVKLGAGHTTTCSGTPWRHADQCGHDKRRRETVDTLNIGSDLTIVDLTGNGCTTLDGVKALNDAGTAIVNVYSADGTSASGTLTTVVVLPIDPANVVIP